ncbi:hypothetical protein [Enterococcus sp. AZ196]|uniref:hypothetical protein n=1 Tax=Enterococcus sp. AZ196 TaxID=2774659 RepID=UPI003D2E1D2D
MKKIIGLGARYLKRAVIFIVLLSVCIGLAACGETTQQTGKDPSPTTKEGKKKWQKEHLILKRKP